MKVKIDDLYRHIGSTVIIKDADIPDATYLVMNISEVGVELYNIKTQTLETSYLDDIEEVLKLTTDIMISLELMEESLILQIVTLSNEGWSIEDNTPMSLHSYLNRLDVIRELRGEINK